MDIVTAAARDASCDLVLSLWWQVSNLPFHSAYTGKLETCRHKRGRASAKPQAAKRKSVPHCTLPVHRLKFSFQDQPPNQQNGQRLLRSLIRANQDIRPPW